MKTMQLKRSAATLCALLIAVVAGAQQIISLAGPWDFTIDRRATDGNGRTAAVAEPPTDYDDYVMLPGSMLTNGKGDIVTTRTQWTGSLYDSSFYFNPWMERYRHDGEMKFPFFLTPDRHYVGRAWYRRRVYVPRAWRDQRVTLFLERPHIETTVFVNGREVGHEMSLSVPHRFDLTKDLKFGENNEIAICVYNGIENVGVGQDSHSVTDQTQGNWNGITGRIELQTQWRRLNIRNVKVVPDALTRTVTVEVKMENHTDGLRFMPLNEWDITVYVDPLNKKAGNRRSAAVIRKEALGSKKVFKIELGKNAALWDEFSPNLYELTITAGDDVYQTTFGLRHVSVSGRKMLINGREMLLRGTVENCLFPATGYPPTDEEEWLRIFRKCKEYGLNHVRFHSYCPPEAAFAAADRVGIYLQPEGPSWPNHGVKLRRGMAIDLYLLDESKRIVDEYGHHPSFVMMAAGNEPAGDWVSYCRDWVKTMHQYDSTRVYCGASVGGGWAWDDGSEFHVKGGARGLDEWQRSLPTAADDYLAGIDFPRNYKGTTPNQSPIIAHEKGQWCAFPDFSEIPQYTGVYKAGNLEIFRDLLRDNGMEEMAGKFLMASGRLQLLAYKYEIERNLRTPDYTGFQLLGLNDYSGQGSALVGPLNVFWREKPYTKAAEWREFCGPIVLLARMPKFVFTDNETLSVPVEVYNAQYGNISDAIVDYSIVDDSLRIVAAGQLKTDTIRFGKNNQVGTVSLPLDGLQSPARYTLRVQLGNVYRNHWNFWVYPSRSDIADSKAEQRELKQQSKICISDTIDARVVKTLQRGGTVLLTAAGRVTLGSDVRQNYLPVFWNTSWFKMRPPHTTGAYIDADHPLFRHGFPTADWADLNWWDLLNRAQVMNLRELPASYQPPVQPIDTWHVSRKLGMIVEARVGEGRLLITTMDITNRLDSRPVARQMRKAILSYMAGADFRPTLQLDLETIRHFYTEQAPPVNMFTNDSPDELKPKIK